MNGQNPSARDLAFGTPSGFFAFGFGSGLSPFAPGTMGTLAAIPLAVVLKLLPVPLFWPLLLLFFLLGVHLCEVTSRRLGQHDPGGIVWDEMVAYWLTVAFCRCTGPGCLRPLSCSAYSTSSSRGRSGGWKNVLAAGWASCSTTSSPPSTPCCCCSWPAYCFNPCSRTPSPLYRPRRSCGLFPPPRRLPRGLQNPSGTPCDAR